MVRKSHSAVQSLALVDYTIQLLVGESAEDYSATISLNEVAPNFQREAKIFAEIVFYFAKNGSYCFRKNYKMVVSTSL